MGGVREDVENKTSELCEDSVDRLAARTRSKLTQARNRALDEVKKAAAKGLVWHEEISTPANGEYFLRIGVRDEHRNKFGAVEVATSQVRNLVPTPAAPTPPAAK